VQPLDNEFNFIHPKMSEKDMKSFGSGKIRTLHGILKMSGAWLI